MKMEMSFALEEFFGGGAGGGGGRGQIGVHRYMQENLIFFFLYCSIITAFSRTQLNVVDRYIRAWIVSISCTNCMAELLMDSTDAA